MLWHLKWGDKREWLEDLSEETGEAIPDMDDPPLVPASILWLLEVFWQLHAMRPSGFGPGAIPLSEMKAAAEIHGPMDAVAFVRIMHALDSAWLTYYAEQQKEEKPQT